MWCSKRARDHRGSSCVQLVIALTKLTTPGGPRPGASFAQTVDPNMTLLAYIQQKALKETTMSTYLKSTIAGLKPDNTALGWLQMSLEDLLNFVSQSDIVAHSKGLPVGVAAFTSRELLAFLDRASSYGECVTSLCCPSELPQHNCTRSGGSVAPLASLLHFVDSRLRTEEATAC